MRSESNSSASKVGMTVSLVFIAIFLAQFVLGLSLGNLIQLFGTSKVIIFFMFTVQLIGSIFLVFNVNNFTES